MKMIKKKKTNNELLNAYQQATVNNSTNKSFQDNTDNVGKSTVRVPAPYSTPTQVTTPTNQTTTLQPSTNGMSTLADSYNYTNKKAPNVKATNQYAALVNERTSAMSNLNAANMQALKYANTAAQAGGYSTQGAANQNIANLQSAYLNQANAINTGHNQDVLELSNTLEQQQAAESKDNLQSYYSAIESYVANGNLTQEKLNDLQSTYLTNVTGKDLQDAKIFTEQAVDSNNKFVENQKAQEIANAQAENRYIDLTSEKNNYKYETSFGNGVATNKNFTVKIGNDTFIVEMGNSPASYLANTSNQKINEQYKDKKVGEIWEHTSGKGNTVLLVKVGDNDIRVVEKSEADYEDYKRLAQTLGYNREENIEYK